MTMNSRELAEKALRKNEWIVEKIDRMELIMSPVLAALQTITHAFTTRVGGHTKAPYDSFNLGRHISDDDLRVDAMSNREKLCQSLSIDFGKLVVPGQVHSRNVEVVTETAQPLDLKGVDGVTTDQTDVPLLLHFADCVPVMVVEPRNRVIGIFHAGWRGTASKIVTNGVETMKRLGADPSLMIGVVGPAIGSCCYPTSDEVAKALQETVSEPTLFVGEKNGQPAPDLKAINAMQLLEAGVPQVDVSDFCTSCNPSMFYSHRQSGGTTGRQGALVALTG